MSIFTPKGARLVAPPVYTPEEQAENARRDAQRFNVGDRVVVPGGRFDLTTRVWSDGHGVVVKAQLTYEASTTYMMAYFGWLHWLLGRPKPPKYWSYKVVFDGEREYPGGPWYGPRSLLPEKKS